MNKILYLPIEVRLRDLYPKLLIAKKAIDNNFSVIIGDRYKIEKISFYAPPSVFFTRGLEAPIYEKLFPKLNKNKTIIVGQDVEAGQFFDNPPVYKFIRVRGNRLKYLSAFFAWGKSEYEYLKKNFSDLNTNFILTGNPIFDVKKYKINKLENQYKIKFKSYYLINLSWALFRPITEIKKDNTIKMFKENGATEKDIKSHFDFGNQRIEENKSLLKAIEKISILLKDKTFIIRPHPSDDLDMFKKNIKLPKNCKIIREDSVLTWIAKAEKIIHPYCNSAFESLISNKIPICYDGFQKETRELLFKKISYFANDTNELLDIIKSKNSSDMLCEKLDHLYDEFPNIRHMNSSDLIIDHIKSYIINKGEIYLRLIYFKLYIYCCYLDFKLFIKKQIKKESIEELTNKSEIFKILKAYGIKNPFKVKKMCNNVYKISR